MLDHDPYREGQGGGWGCRARFQDYIDDTLKVEQPQVCHSVRIENFMNWFGPGGRIFSELLSEDNAQARQSGTAEEVHNNIGFTISYTCMHKARKNKNT